MRPYNIQDVAYGSRAYKLDDGSSFICPQWIRKNHRAKMVRAFKQEFLQPRTVEDLPLRTWMYKVMDWVAKKDMKSMAGLDNTDVEGKQALVRIAGLATKVMNVLGDAMPGEVVGPVSTMSTEMEECKAVLRQHLEDNMKPNSNVGSHCLNHALNPTENFQCSHEHQHWCASSCGCADKQRARTQKAANTAA